MTTPAVIDSHLHLWNRSTSDYAWITPALGVDADFEQAEARAALDAAGVASAILVQADDSAADTRYLVEVARTQPWVLGVVAWAPLDDPASAAALLEEWTREPVICGVRQLVHIDPRDGLLEDPRVLESLGLVAGSGLAFDVPDAWPRLLAAVPTIARSVPDLTIVIDHLAKPLAAGFAEWETTLRAAARHPTVVAKVSGLQGLPDDVVRRAWDVALDAFGPARLLYGGDWPMTVPFGGYPPAWRTLSTLIGELSPAEQAEVLSGTAIRTYRLELREASWQ